MENILVCDDDKEIVDAIEIYLSQEDFRVYKAYDGIEALEIIKKTKISLAIVDIMMPKMDGFQVARQVRAKRCSTPILMLTARSSLEDRVEGLNAGADYYLTKPFDTRELMACINALLRRQGGQVDELRYGNTSLDLASGMLVCGRRGVRRKQRGSTIIRMSLESMRE